jgi:zinc D-Ala-D-Ala carboxypeptidase
MRLTPNFTLAEMIVSQTASRRGIDNTPPPAVVTALTLLCNRVLEPVRVHYKRPVIVTSGYRSPAVNKAVGGAASSQHVLGEASDFTVHGVSNLEVCRWMEKNLNYDQLIYEFGESGWIHVSYRADRLRNMELSAVRRGGKTVYLPGLVA